MPQLKEKLSPSWASSKTNTGRRLKMLTHFTPATEQVKFQVAMCFDCIIDY